MIKQDEYECVDRRKARFVANGYAQQMPMHYDATWAPSAHYATLSHLISLAVHLDLMIRHIDVKCASLNGALEEEIYIEQPAIINGDHTHNPPLFLKALYGLNQPVPMAAAPARCSSLS
jgi:hypothetical protein